MEVLYHLFYIFIDIWFQFSLSSFFVVISIRVRVKLNKLKDKNISIGEQDLSKDENYHDE